MRNRVAEPRIFDTVQCDRKIYRHINCFIMWTPIKINMNLARNFIPFYFIWHRPFGDNLMTSLCHYPGGNRRAVCGGNKISARHIDPLSIVHLICTNTLKAYKLFISNHPQQPWIFDLAHFAHSHFLFLSAGYPDLWEYDSDYVLIRAVRMFCLNFPKA